MYRVRLLLLCIATGAIAVCLGLLPSTKPLVPLIADLLYPHVVNIVLGVSWLLSEIVLRLLSSIFRTFTPCLGVGVWVSRHKGVAFFLRILVWLVESLMRVVLNKSLLGVLADLLDYGRCIARPSVGLVGFVYSILRPGMPPHSDPRCVYLIPIFRAALDIDNRLATPLLGLVVFAQSSFTLLRSFS
jgi:hypothetical protein